MDSIISDSEHVIKVLLSSYVLLTFPNTIVKYARVILHNVEEVYIFKHALYFSVYVRLISRKNVLL